MAYARWLSAQTGLNFSLPTEAEWEYAARGADGRIWPWGNTWEVGRANSKEAGINRTTPVGSYPSGVSPYGALDMAGNVWEWTRSIPNPYPYNAADGRENLSDPRRKHFSICGGSASDKAPSLRAASRISYTPDIDNPDIGFRLVRHP